MTGTRVLQLAVLFAVTVVVSAVVLRACTRDDDAVPPTTSGVATGGTDTPGVVSGAPRYASVEELAQVLSDGGIVCEQVTTSDDPLLAAREHGVCTRQLGTIVLRVYDGPPPAPAYEGYARSVLCPQQLDAFRYTRGANWTAYVEPVIPEDGPATQAAEEVVSLGGVTGGEVVTVPCLAAG